MDINNILVDKNISIRKGIDILDKSGKKIIIIVEDKKIIGVVTDGDVRRWILKNKDLSDGLENIMNRNPKYVFEGEEDKAKELMDKYKIEAIPVVDKELQVINIIYSSDIYQKQCRNFNKRETPIVIMAGGKGSRLHPYTKIIPKMLIPIGDITIIERIIDRFLQFYFNNFFITINYKKDLIKAYFNKEVPYNLQFIDEDKPLGTAGSLFFLKGKIRESFFVSNCDILVDANYSDVLNFHKKEKNKVTVVTALKTYIIPYGVFNLDEKGAVLSLDEKPAYEFLVNTGMYVLEPEILEYIEEDCYCDMTDIIYKALSNNDKVGIYPVTDGEWLDMGEFETLKNMIDKLEN